MPGSVLRVGVVEDQPLYRDMMVALIGARPGIELALVAAGQAEARRGFTPGMLDVALLDVYLADGNGLALGVSLRRADPRLGIVLLSSQDVLELLLDLPADVAGRWSYLSKNSGTSAETLLQVIRASAQGETVIDPELVRRSRRRADSSLAALSKRQYEVLSLVAAGLSNALIAEHLGLSPRSVANHINAVYRLLDIPADHNPRVSAVLRFIEETSRSDY